MAGSRPLATLGTLKSRPHRRGDDAALSEGQLSSGLASREGISRESCIGSGNIGAREAEYRWTTKWTHAGPPRTTLCGTSKEFGGREWQAARIHRDPDGDEPDQKKRRTSTTATTGLGLLADHKERERQDGDAHPRPRRQEDATSLQPRGGSRDVPPAWGYR